MKELAIHGHWMKVKAISLSDYFFAAKEAQLLMTYFNSEMENWSAESRLERWRKESLAALLCSSLDLMI